MGVFSKRELEGYVRIDNRDSPGFSCDEAVAGGRSSIAPLVGPGQLFEAATDSCSHCQRIVIRNPLRTRERGYCSKCDHYICDWCAESLRATGICIPFIKVIEDAANRQAKGIIHG